MTSEGCALAFRVAGTPREAAGVHRDEFAIVAVISVQLLFSADGLRDQLRRTSATEGAQEPPCLGVKSRADC